MGSRPAATASILHKESKQMLFSERQPALDAAAEQLHQCRTARPV